MQTVHGAQHGCPTQLSIAQQHATCYEQKQRGGTPQAAAAAHAPVVSKYHMCKHPVLDCSVRCALAPLPRSEYASEIRSKYADTMVAGWK